MYRPSQAKVHSTVLMCVIMVFDLILITAVVPTVRKIESNKDKILKVSLSGNVPCCTARVICAEGVIDGRVVRCRSSWMSRLLLSVT